MTQEKQNLRLGRNLGDALAVIIRGVFPHHTAKQVAQRWSLDPATAANAAKGIASATTIAKAVHAEGEEAWELWHALGEALIGESFDEYREKKINRIIEEAQRDHEKVRRLRQTAEAVLQRSSSVVEALHREDHRQSL